MDAIDLRRAFGRRVQGLRDLRGLTQEQLAEAIERSVDTVSNIERGVSTPRLETARQLAEALGVGFQELFEFDPLEETPDREKRRALDQVLALLKDKDAETIRRLQELLIAGLNLAGHRAKRRA